MSASAECRTDGSQGAPSWSPSLGPKPVENAPEPLRLKQALRESFDDDGVQLVHRDGAAPAGGLALPGAGRAGGVFVDLARGPGPQRHGAAANEPADRMAGKFVESNKGSCIETGLQGRPVRPATNSSPKPSVAQR
jgi:hypothetical protein